MAVNHPKQHITIWTPTGSIEKSTLFQIDGELTEKLTILAKKQGVHIQEVIGLALVGWWIAFQGDNK